MKEAVSVLLWRLAYWRSKMFERMLIFIAWHMPRELVRWCFFRVFAHGTTGVFGRECPSDTRAMDLAKRWEGS